MKSANTSPMTNAIISAIYFDGQTARRHPVTLLIHKRIVAISGEGVRRSVRLSKLDISERLEQAPRILRLPDGASIHSMDPGLDRLLRKNGYREPWVVRWQMQWKRSLGALVTLLAVLISGYQWGLPWAADTMAQHLPASLEKSIGDEQLALIDQEYMEPSRLPAPEQERLRQLFAQLNQPRGEKTPYRLEFRHSEMGANAFALPNGMIIMTDELVTLAQNDHAVLGVLSHELGHVQRRHSLRHMLQAIGVGAVINLLVGDVSAVLAAAPTFLLDMKYSRDFEREADQYAIDMMRENRLPLSPMADLFEKMAAQENEAALSCDAPEQTEDGEEDSDAMDAPSGGKERRGEALDYLSSHPSDDERIARLRAADGK